MFRVATWIHFRVITIILLLLHNSALPKYSYIHSHDYYHYYSISSLHRTFRKRPFTAPRNPVHCLWRKEHTLFIQSIPLCTSWPGNVSWCFLLRLFITLKDGEVHSVILSVGQEKTTEWIHKGIQKLQSFLASSSSSFFCNNKKRLKSQKVAGAIFIQMMMTKWLFLVGGGWPENILNCNKDE